MRQSLTICIGLALGLILVGNAGAVARNPSPDRYASIPERNAFGLKSPPQINVTSAPPQLPKLILTGITTILGNKRALMLEAPPANKPADRPKEESLILTEGQRQGDVEVLQIDEKAGSVMVNHSGQIMTLTFEKDGLKLPNTPMPMPMRPGAPGMVPTPTYLPPGTQSPNRGVLGLPQYRVPGRVPPGPAGGLTPTGRMAFPAPSAPVTPPQAAPTESSAASGSAPQPSPPADLAQSPAANPAPLPQAAAISPPSLSTPSDSGVAAATEPAPTTDALSLTGLPNDLTPEEKMIFLDLQQQGNMDLGIPASPASAPAQ
ncbi:MAG TPA: hypothetical protein VG146_05330 [Verrucomicrobiae bacterium]|nr:hypothetical protein [Verrucomicrobiae bacterium]